MPERRLDHFPVLDEVTIGQIQQRLELTEQDMGPVRARYRATLGWLGTAVVLCPLLIYPLLYPFAAPGARTPAFAALMLLGPLLATGPFAVRGWLEQHRVCEHGLVVGWRDRYVIPWSTVDPGRMRLLRRANLLPRYGESTGPRVRTGTTLGHALVVNGLDSTPEGHKRVAFNATLVAEGRGGDPGLTCFHRWYLSGRHARRLLASIEEAMVADGYPVEGMTAAVSGRELTLRYQPEPVPDGVPNDQISPLREITDPPLWGAPPR